MDFPEAKLAALQEEMATIRFADAMYLRRTGHTSVATSEYERRQKRLEQIRAALLFGARKEAPEPA